MKWIIAFLVLAPLTSKCQKVSFPNGKLEFDTVVSVTADKTDLFTRAQQFVIGAYKSGKDVTQMADKDAGIVIGRGTLTYTYKFNFLYSYTGYAWHTMKILIKDNKYKIELAFDECKVVADKWTMDENIDKFYTEHNGDKSVAEITQKGHALLASCVTAMATKPEDF